MTLAPPPSGFARARKGALKQAARPYRVSVDVIFADTLPHAVRKAMLKDARRASEL